jgi:hypothetical protein
MRGSIVRRTLPHGHVAAVLRTRRNMGLDRMLGPPRSAAVILSSP